MSERRVYPLRSVLDRELSVSSSGCYGNNNNSLPEPAGGETAGKRAEACRTSANRKALRNYPRRFAFSGPRRPYAALPRAPTAPSPRRSLYSMLTLPVVQTFPQYHQRPRAKGFVSSRPVHPVAPRPTFAE